MSSKTKKSKKEYHSTSKLIHGEMTNEFWDYSHHVVPPITSSSTYRLESVERGAEGFVAFGKHPLGEPGHAPIYIYDRLGEPSGMMLQSRLADAEGGEIGVVFASGMAAISAAVMSNLKAGDHVLADGELYGCTYSLFTNWLPRYGIEVSLIDFKDFSAVKKNFRQSTKVMYCETPTNPCLNIHDIEALAQIKNDLNRKHKAKCQFIIDNTFATPFCQRPISLGADIVVHSLTKSINGFGTDTGGVVIGSHKLENELMLWRKDFGGILSPKSAWNHLVYGIPTLPLRIRQQERSALKVAQFLEDHPRVDNVLYPGLKSHPHFGIAQKQMRSPEGDFAPGTMIYFSLAGKGPVDRQKRAIAMMNNLAKESYCITLAVSLGQVRTLVEHPSSMTHSTIPPEEQIKIGIDPAGIRLSIGLEDAGDIIGDLKRGLGE